jgi:hypothetical protein
MPRDCGTTFGPWVVGFSFGLVRDWDKLLSFSFGVSWIPPLRKTRELRNTERPALGRTNETLSVCLGRVLVKLLFTGVELRIGFGGLELENLRIFTGGTLTSSSSEEVASLSSWSALDSCVAKWIGCGIALGRVYETD